MLLVSGCKGNHFFRNAKTFSGKICIRLQKSCKNDAPAPPPRLHTVATAPPDGRRHSGARRRPGATPRQGQATGPVSGCRKARLARQRRPFCKPAPQVDGKTAVAQRVARQAEGRNNPRRQPASGPAGHRPTRCPRQHHPTPPSRPKMASHTRPQCIFCPKDLPVLHIYCNFVPQIQHHLIWNYNDSQLIARQARHYLRRAQ